MFDCNLSMVLVGRPLTTDHQLYAPFTFVYSVYIISKREVIPTGNVIYTCPGETRGQSLGNIFKIERYELPLVTNIDVGTRGHWGHVPSKILQ